MAKAKRQKMVRGLDWLEKICNALAMTMQRARSAVNTAAAMSSVPRLVARKECAASSASRRSTTGAIMTPALKMEPTLRRRTRTATSKRLENLRSEERMGLRVRSRMGDCSVMAILSVGHALTQSMHMVQSMLPTLVGR